MCDAVELVAENNFEEDAVIFVVFFCVVVCRGVRIVVCTDKGVRPGVIAI